MVSRRPGLPGEALSSSCNVFERAERHAQNIGTGETRSSALLQECIKCARITCSFTREDAARDIGVSRESLWRWENGLASPKVEKILEAPKMGPAFREQWDRVFGVRRAA